MNWENSEGTIEFDDGTKVSAGSDVGQLSERLGQALRESVAGPMMHVSFGGAVVSLGRVCGSDGRRSVSKLIMQIAYTLEHEPDCRITVFGSDWSKVKTIRSMTSEGERRDPVESEDPSLSSGSGSSSGARIPAAEAGVRTALV